MKEDRHHQGHDDETFGHGSPHEVSDGLVTRLAEEVQLAVDEAGDADGVEQEGPVEGEAHLEDEVREVVLPPVGAEGALVSHVENLGGLGLRLLGLYLEDGIDVICWGGEHQLRKIHMYNPRKTLHIFFFALSHHKRFEVGTVRSCD